jgi:lipoyl(octanoyl) transferase
MSSVKPTLIIRCFNDLQDYTARFEAMKDFTTNRDETTPDEVWLLQHQDVLTQGQAGKAEHILTHSSLPVVHTDRGDKSLGMVRVNSLPISY